MSQAGQENVMVDVDLGTRFSLQRIELHWRSNFSVLPLSSLFLFATSRAYHVCIFVCVRAPVGAFVCVFVYAFLHEHSRHSR